ncbi:hypothetical protein BC940DRAFT_334788 [Gongronella butleri]|nr:hypothetical protein BC940DRAFT_334788 [Gongronella butleri]
MDIQARDRLVAHVTGITETGEWVLDKEILKDIKRTCKQAPLYVETTYEVMFAQLKKKHAQIRYSCLQLCEELFQRSHQFRQLLMDDFPTFIELSVGIRNASLPPPAEVAVKLRKYAIALIKNWYAHYGEHLRPLSIGYDYLEHNDLLRNDQSLQSIHQADHLSANKQARLKVIEERRLQQIKDDMEGHLDLVKETLTNMESCFEILVPKNDGGDDLDFDALLKGTWNDASASTNQEDYKQELISHGLASNRYAITISVPANPLAEQVHESADNSIIYEQLREAYKVLETKQSKQVNAWINSLIRMDHVEKSEKDRLIKQLIDVKHEMADAVRKVKLLGIELPPDRRASRQGNNGADDDDDDDMDELFEDIEIPDHLADSQDINKVASSKLPPSQRIFPLAFEPQMVDDVTYTGAQIEQPAQDTSETPETSKKNKGKGRQAADNDREELLKRAPVVEWGDDLFYWDKTNVLFNQSGLEFSHRFMGTGEGMNEMPEHLLDDLRKRMVYYKGQDHSNLKACRHPLKNGGLCPRRDLVTCPFHGKIVPRDELGQPSAGEGSSTGASADASFSAAAASSSSSSTRPPAGVTDLWEEIEGEVMQQQGKERIDLSRRRRRAARGGKKKSALIDINKKPDTPYTRLKRKVESKASRRMVDEANAYEEDIKSRDRKASLWR